MALTIHRTGADEYGKYVRASINGDPGSWKTIFGSTWPNPLIASVSANLMSIADRGVPYVPIESSTDLLSLLNALDNPPDKREKLLGTPVDTLVVDCFDHYQQVVAAERKRDQRKDVLAGADWGWLGDEMRAVLRRLRVLPVHVLVLGHLKTVEDQETGSVSVLPSYQGALSSEIAGFVDLALVFKAAATMEANEDGEPVRVVNRYAQTYPDSRYGWDHTRTDFGMKFQYLRHPAQDSTDLRFYPDAGAVRPVPPRSLRSSRFPKLAALPRDRDLRE